MKTLGTSRMDGKHRITVPRIVMDKLNLAPMSGDEPGDFVRFAIDDKGRIYIEKLE